MAHLVYYVVVTDTDKAECGSLHSICWSHLRSADLWRRTGKPRLAITFYQNASTYM